MSLDMYELFLEIEEDFDIHFAEPDLQPVATVGELFEVTLNNLRKQHPERFDAVVDYEQHAWQELKELLVNQLGVRPEQVVKSAEFVRDLGTG